jgi:hypothetical protein
MGVKDNKRNTDKYDSAISLICSIISFKYLPIKANQFATALSIYMHTMGIKRHVLSMFAGLGVIPLYATIIKRIGKLANLSKVSGPTYMKNQLLKLLYMVLTPYYN